MIRTLAITVMLSIMTGCASNVVTDYDSTATFGSYGSWNFAPSGESGNDYVSLDGARVVQAIEREMKREAMRKVEAEEADLLVAWRIESEERLERQGATFGFGFGSGNFGWGLSAPPPVEKIEEGKLVLEFVDSDSKRVVWRAASKRYLNEDQSTETRRELIDSIVADMFESYPPGV